MCAITGRSSTGTIGLLISYVSGRRRVPSPAARTIALIAPARYRESPKRLIPVVVWLVRSCDGGADVGGQRVEVQARDLLVEVLGQHVDALLVLVVLGEQLHLGDHLVGERVAHHEARV